MAFRSIEEAKRLKTAYCPEFEVYVTLLDCWKNANDQTIYLCKADDRYGFNGEYVKKMFTGHELTKFCM
jgi:hypothetical protein